MIESPGFDESSIPQMERTQFQKDLKMRSLYTAVLLFAATTMMTGCTFKIAGPCKTLESRCACNKCTLSIEDKCAGWMRNAVTGVPRPMQTAIAATECCGNVGTDCGCSATVSDCGNDCAAPAADCGCNTRPVAFGGLFAGQRNVPAGDCSQCQLGMNLPRPSMNFALPSLRLGARACGCGGQATGCGCESGAAAGCDSGCQEQADCQTCESDIPAERTYTLVDNRAEATGCDDGCGGSCGLAGGGLLAKIKGGLTHKFSDCDSGTCGDAAGCASGTCGVGGGASYQGCGQGGCGTNGGYCQGCLSKIWGVIGPGRHPYGGAIPHTYGNQQSGQAPTYAYPYYTTRGPRDFLKDNPPTIGY